MTRAKRLAAHKRKTQQAYRAYRAAYASATETERIQGRLWYPTATALCHEIAHAHGHDWHNVARTLAALSPKISWERNIALTWDIAAGRPVTAVLYANRDKACASLDGHRVLGGPKVRAFAAAILGYRNAACIDTHMLRCAGFPTEPRITDVRACKAALVRLAHETGEEARAVQAIIWLVQHNGPAPF